MRQLICITLLSWLSLTLLSVGAARAGKQVMTIGKDTRSFHIELDGKRVVTDDPHEDFAIRFGQMVFAITGQKQAAGIGIRQIDRYRNAFAVVHQGEPYVLFDADIWGRAGGGVLKEMVLYGHELGHHICGHLKGAMRDQPWNKELEADRFAGAAIRAYVEAGFNTADDNVNHDTMIQAVNAVFIAAGVQRGGPTHPPLDLRARAFSEGWKNGSPCKL